MKTRSDRNLKDISVAFNMIGNLEERFPVDSIKLSDGTKIWNLVRVILCFYIQKQDGGIEAEEISSKTLFYLLKEGFSPLNLSNKEIDICGFSGTESRKFRNGKFYDIYMDPLYDVIDCDFYVFEWPTSQGYRRNYRKNIYSKNYTQMHIPIFSKAFLNIGIYKLLQRKGFSIESESTLREIIEYFSKKTLLNENKLSRYVDDAIAVFFNMKGFFVKNLHKISPKAVLIRCGYGRFHMALSQACKELNIPSIELQHGIITKYNVGYVKTTVSENRDCVPDYIFTYGDIFSNIIKNGNLFTHDKVFTTGFPYIEEIIESPPSINDRLKDFISKFSINILLTSQWPVADEIKNFVLDILKELKKSKQNVGIVFKPHPRDWRDYSDMEKSENIFITDKYDDVYEILKVIDIHSTVYSTSGLESLAFGKPNIFIDVGKTSIKKIIDVVDNQTSFMVASPQQFIERTNHIISNYKIISKDTIRVSEMFFKPNAKENIEEKLKIIGINTKHD
jgi:hypothetical protein